MKSRSHIAETIMILRNNTVSITNPQMEEIEGLLECSSQQSDSPEEERQSYVDLTEIFDLIRTHKNNEAKGAIESSRGDISSTNHKNQKLLAASICYDNEEMAYFLLVKGANLDAGRDIYGRTPRDYLVERHMCHLLFDAVALDTLWRSSISARVNLTYASCAGVAILQIMTAYYVVLVTQVV